jgi:hypothetical protein
MLALEYVFGTGAHPGGGGFSSAALLSPQNRNLRNANFAGTMVSKVLCDFPFSRNQPLKSAADQYVRILKNIVIKFKKTRS